MRKIKIDISKRRAVGRKVDYKPRVNVNSQNKATRRGTPKLVKYFSLSLLVVVLVSAGLYFFRDNSVVKSAVETVAEVVLPDLDKVDEKTNILLVGIDTREEGSGSTLMNTDTLMLATVYHETGKTRIVSFPRDLYAPYGCRDSGLPYKTKINAIYAYGVYNCEGGDGMATLSDTVEKITGESIQYTALVKLNAVVDVVDELGGVTVDVPETFVDVYPYTELDEDLQQSCIRSRSLPAYCEFKFEAGSQNMDGRTALIYSRMRKYSSDFYRARRQQQVVDGIKSKVLADDTPTQEKASNLLKIYGVVSKNIEADINLNTILAVLKTAGQVDTSPMKVVLDPAFGGGDVIVTGQGSNYNFTDYTFGKVQQELDLIQEYSGAYKDDTTIYAVNKTGVAWTGANPIIELRNSDLWFVSKNLITDTIAKKPEEQELVGARIVDFSNGEKQATVEFLRSRLEAAGVSIEIIDGNNQATEIADPEGSGEQVVPTGPTYTQTQFGEGVAVYIYNL